jgi:signal transduction histidine kinase/ActR/RegA family two-component response regulator
LTVEGWRWFEWSAKANLNDKGHMRSIISVGRDITQKIDFEKRLRQYQKMEAVGRLAGGIAHEFNNMLGIIIGNTELALDDLEHGHLVKDNLDEIKLASLRARDVVKQLLDFSHKSDLLRRPLNIDVTVRETLKLVRASMPSTIEIIEEISAETQTIMADHNQLQQVFINLTTNAFQAMGRDGGTLTIYLSPVILDKIEASRHPDLTPGTYILLSISDTGQGIAQEIRNKIFDPYFTTQEIGQGSGMGLAIAHGIVHNHGGIIEVDSTVGKGSTFSIYLPRIESQATASEMDLKRPIPTGNERILFIDDEYAITKAARSILSRLGYHVTVENDPGKALEMFYAAPDRYDLVITDMTMPKLNGDGLARKILKKRANMPIIICTGHSDRLDAQKAKKIGIAYYADKPLAKHQLADIIRKALDGQTRLDD